jgi:arylsulfatase A-like enzyme
MLPVSLFVLAAFESFHAPFGLLLKEPLHILRMLMLQSAGIGKFLWPVIALEGAVSVFVLFAPRRGFHRSFLLGGSVLCMASAVGFAYYTLIGYARFRGYLPFILAHVAVFSFLLWQLLCLFEVKFPLKSRRISSVLYVGTPIAALVSFVGLNLANYRLYYDAYPTLHLCVMQISFLLLHVGLGGLAHMFFPRFFARKASGKIAVGVAFVATAALILMGHSKFAAPSKPIYLRFTALGQCDVQSGETASALSLIGDDNLVEVRSDPDGAARFQRMSNLPTLPDDFNLEDYNILQISVEATRFRETSFANAKMNLTPNLLQFAKDGAFSFTRAYSGSSYTVQSFSSIFRMVYPSASGVHLRDPRWDGYLDPKLPTAPGFLSEIGYDSFWRPYSGAGGYKYLLGGFDARFKDVKDNELDEDVLQSAMDAISKRAKSDKRFFGWVFFSSPHRPYDAHFDDMPSASNLDRYRQEIRYVDGIIARLIEHVKKEGLLDKTIIIIHGDHGEELNEHGKLGHHSIYDEANHVPLLIRIPGMKGTSMNKPTSLIYLYPWLFLKGPDALKQFAVERMKENIGPVMKETDGAVVVEIFGHYGTRSALVYDKYSLFYDFSSKFYELYDYPKDPRQENNIFDETDDISKKLKRYFERYLQIHYAKRDITFDSGNADAPETDAHREQVEALVKSLSDAPPSEVIDALDHEDWRVRQKAAIVAGEQKLGDKKAVDTLIILLADTSKWVRKESMKSLGLIGVDAAPALIDALKEGSPVRKLKFTPDIGKKAQPVSTSIKLTLKSIGPEVIPLLIEALDSDDIQLQKNISGALGLFGRKAVKAIPELIKMTSRDDPVLRGNVIGDLSLIAPLDDKVQAAVAKALLDNDPTVRRIAEGAQKRIEKAKEKDNVNQ